MTCLKKQSLICDFLISLQSASIEKLIVTALLKFASGFDKQKGAIFELGFSSELDPSGGKLKISGVDHET